MRPPVQNDRAGQRCLTAVDTVTIEPGEAVETPAIVIVGWPAKATVSVPDSGCVSGSIAWSKCVNDPSMGLPIFQYALRTGRRLPLNFVGVDGLIEPSKRQLPAAAEGKVVAQRQVVHGSRDQDGARSAPRAESRGELHARAEQVTALSHGSPAATPVRMAIASSGFSKL